MTNGPKLKALDGGEDRALNHALSLAAEVVPHDMPVEAVVERAQTLAGLTVQAVRQEGDGAILASVALAISDRSLKLAFMEEVGACLL